MDCFRTYFTHVQTCNVTRVQSATEWTASVHTLHIQTCNVTRVQSATEWTASVHTLHMSKPVDNGVNVTRGIDIITISGGVLQDDMTCLRQRSSRKPQGRNAVVRICFFVR